MITKPEGYDEAQPMTGDFEQLPAGGYVCFIRKAEEIKSKNGKPMLEIYLDVAEGRYSNFFADAYKSNTKDNKKWGCVYRQMLTPESAGFYKGLVQDINTSNGFEWNFEEDNLKGKRIGMLFRREAYEGQDGGIRYYTKPYQPRTIQKIRDGDYTMPEDLPLQKKKSAFSPNVVNIQEIDEDLPF